MNKSKVTQEMVAESSDDLFTSAKNISCKGLQQYFTPPAFAEWLAETSLGFIRSPDPKVLDPTAGSGNLLNPFARSHCDTYGLELDKTVLNPALGVRAGNLQKVAPYLNELELTWDVLALNPPFGLDWTNSDGKIVNSCAETFRIAEGLAANSSVCFMICDERNWRHFTAGELGKWQLGAFFRVSGLFAPESDCVCIVSFWGTESYKLNQDLGDLVFSRFKSWRSDVADQVNDCFNHIGYLESTANDEAFRACVSAANQTGAARETEYNLYLKRGLIKVHLSDFECLKLKDKSRDNKQLNAIRKLGGRSPRYFSLNTIDADLLFSWVKAGDVTIDPALEHEITRAVSAALKLTAPFYTLKPTQRLGYLDRINEIRCIKSDEKRGFVAGKRYPLSVSIIVKEESAHRGIQRKNRDTGEFEPDVRETQRTSKHLQIQIKNHWEVPEEEVVFPESGVYVFNEVPEDIMYICEYFEVPDPGNIADLRQSEYRKWRAELTKFEKSGRLTLREFQKDDIARFLIRGSGVCGWEQGLGKMLFGLLWARARGLRRVLVIAPQDLIVQWTSEAASKLGVRLHRIKSIAEARALARLPKPGPDDPPEFYIVHYEAVSRNGSMYEAPTPERSRLGGTLYRKFPEATDLADYYANKRTELVAKYGKKKKPEDRSGPALHSDKTCPSCGSHLSWSGNYCNPKVSWKIDKTHTGRGCGYVHTAKRIHPMSHWLKKTFSGVICDEGTKIQADNSRMSLAVRSLRPKHRLVLSGTPIKNYLPSAFWLLWWANGGRSTATFPYNREEKDKFTSDYCVQERDKPSEATDNKWGVTKTLPELCNVNMLWKLLGPNMLRRRKSETGESLVEKRMLPVFCPMGSQQSLTYTWWVHNFGDWYASRPDKDVDDAAFATAFAAIFGQHWKLRFVSSVPASPGLAQYDGKVSHSNATPKLLTCLQLIRDSLEAREPIIVFNAMREGSLLIKTHLDRAGIKCRVADGQTKPADRAALMAEFKAGKFQVLLAGIEAVNLGHNLENSRRAIVYSLPWDLAGFEQAINRIHRLTSKRDCLVHILCTVGSIDAKIWDLIERKGAYAGLALDGALGYDDVKELDWNEFLRDLRDSFEEAANTIPEAILEDRLAEVFSGLHIVKDRHGHQTGAAAGLLDMALSQSKFTFDPFN